VQAAAAPTRWKKWSAILAWRIEFDDKAKENRGLTLMALG
jgi:hypothetical protein